VGEIRIPVSDPLAQWGLRIPAGNLRLTYASTLKRGLDVVFAALLLVVTMPLWLVIAVAIKLDSPGPWLFAQERVGFGGRRFQFLKFRSMGVDADRLLESLLAKNEVDGPTFKLRQDPRVTRVGRFLRRTSLDELPQLINVLRGEMSMVGPRPPLQREVDQYEPSDMVRLSVMPGITCLWQVNGRSDTSFEQWMAYDREYVERLSFGLDLWIIVRTVGVVLSCRGAY